MNFLMNVFSLSVWTIRTAGKRKISTSLVSQYLLLTMHSTSSWYLPHSVSLQSWRTFANITTLTPFARLRQNLIRFPNFATNSYMYCKRAYGAPIWAQCVRFTAKLSKRICCKHFCRPLQLTCHNLSFVSCLISSWRISTSDQSHWTKSWQQPASKSQMRLHNFPSLRQQCQETCPFYCAIQEQKAISGGIAAPGTKYEPETASFAGEY